ncbi:hypothetical protein LAWI1_G000048 [Lachnellula willkommii]|uniref:Uncharacterized protein n=1 Tax=Lachnellula willkommii TaxID=215461 RepID=A0A559MNG1_9HELO|nr:hypothetical protein LAWI1_G000048 [Lachnellula willkommii]
MFAWLTAVISQLIAGRGKEPHPSSSYFERHQRDEGENQRLLPHDVEAEEFDHHDGCFPPHAPNQTSPYADLPVYTTIHRPRPISVFVAWANSSDLAICLGYGETSSPQ